MWIPGACAFILSAGRQAQAMLPEIKPRIETAKQLAQDLSEIDGIQVRVSPQLEDKNIGRSFHLPFTGPGPNGEPPKILMSRDQFEAQEANTIVVSAPALLAQISIQIAPGASIEKHWRENLGAHSEPVRFSDLSQEMRDAIWNQAVERDLALAKTMHPIISPGTVKTPPPP